MDVSATTPYVRDFAKPRTRIRLKAIAVYALRLADAALSAQPGVDCSVHATREEYKDALGRVIDDLADAPAVPALPSAGGAVPRVFFHAPGASPAALRNNNNGEPAGVVVTDHAHQLRALISSPTRAYGRSIPNKGLCKHGAWRNWGITRQFAGAADVAAHFGAATMFTEFHECMERGVYVVELRVRASCGGADAAAPAVTSAAILYPREWHNDAFSADDLALSKTLFPSRRRKGAKADSPSAGSRAAKAAARKSTGATAAATAAATVATLVNLQQGKVSTKKRTLSTAQLTDDDLAEAMGLVLAPAELATAPATEMVLDAGFSYPTAACLFAGEATGRTEPPAKRQKLSTGYAPVTTLAPLEPYYYPGSPTASTVSDAVVPSSNNGSDLGLGDDQVAAFDDSDLIEWLTLAPVAPVAPVAPASAPTKADPMFDAFLPSTFTLDALLATI